jgi:hypothetical protein
MTLMKILQLRKKINKKTKVFANFSSLSNRLFRKPVTRKNYENRIDIKSKTQINKHKLQIEIK